MSMQLHPAKLNLKSGFRAGPWLLMAACGLCLIPCSIRGQSEKGHDKNSPTERSHPDRVPPRPSLAPAFTIAIDSLGFSAPGSIYLGQRFSFASLDFLDEDRLLLTFRVPGLIHRTPRSGDAKSTDEDEGDERHIKALVLALPSGAVQSEAIWPLHDRFRYLWTLKDGHFLVRDRDELLLGDATLELKPYLRFPGPVLSIQMDPLRRLIVTNSREPAAAKSNAGEASGPKDASATAAGSGDSSSSPDPTPNLVVRILRRDSGKAILVNRVRSAVHLPINSDGYLEMLPPTRGADWIVNLNGFAGSSTKIGEVESTCSPGYDFISESEFLVSTCSRTEIRGMVAMNTAGKHLWEDMPASSPVWPLMIASTDGSLVARESIVVNHTVSAFAPLTFDDVKGQLVEVFDAATGKIELSAAVSPVLDAGGNVAISPSGRRVAVLNAGAIQVFELPPAAAQSGQAEKAGP